MSDWDAQGIGLILGPQATGIALDTPPTPERRIADLEERLRHAIGEREQTIAKASAQAAELVAEVAKEKARGDWLSGAYDAEHSRLKAALSRGDVALGALEKAEAELAEISQRQGATHHHWQDIAAMPQVWIGKRAGDTCHESVMRSFHVAEEVRRLLDLGTPVAVVLLVMDLLENRGRS